MKKYALLVFLMLIFACSSEQKGHMDLFNNARFQLLEGETNMEITTDVKNDYFRLIDYRPVQVPLFRYVKNDEYDIYIGIPYNAELELFIGSGLFDNFNDYFSQTDSTTFDYKLYKSDSLYVTEYVYVLQGNLIYILTQTASENVLDSLFNYTQIAGRITTR